MGDRDDSDLAPGTRLGRFEIARRLGAGGMGVVYEARDPELNRAVAVKLLHGARADSLRLLREAQALAQLQHPNVVVVHDVGVTGGALFLAMELVDGATLDVHLAKSRAPWRRIVELYVQAARGLAAAHAKSIVHRDFKPANVIVDRDGRVRVTDFGLARIADGAIGAAPDAEQDAIANAETITGDATDDDAGTVATPDLLAAPLTGAGALIGTPRYMAPEQRARGAATARSDQYAWCVALWEALFGALPPARGDRRVPRWLVRALERGLDPDPARRFPSMTALCDELERAPRARRRAAIAAGAALLAGGATWLVLATRTSTPDPCGAIGPLPEWNADARAAVQRAFAGSKAAYAGDAFATVARRLDDYGDRWRAMRETSCRATRVTHTQSEAMLDARDLCLDRRRDEVVALIAALRATDATTIDKAVDAVGHLGDLAACEPGAAARVAPLPQDPARAKAIRDLERELDGLDAALATGRVGDRAPLVAGAATRARATGYRPLAAAAARTELALAQDRDDWPAAIAAGQRGVETAEASGDDELRFDFLATLIEMYGFRLQQPDEADRARRAAEALFARLGDAPARAARLHCAIALSLWWKGDWDQALARVKTCVADRERTVPRDDGALARALHLEAIVDDELGRVDDSWAAESRAIELGVKTFGARHPYVGRFDITAGGVLRELHRDADAEAKLKEAADILLESQGEIADVGTALLDLGILYMDEERYADAAATMQRSVAILERQSIPDHENVAHALDVLGMALLRSGHPDEGEAAALRSLAMRERAGMADHPGTANAHRSLGKQYRLRKLWDKALAQYAESERILTKKFGADSPELATTWIGQADIALDRGRPADARAPLERALAATDKPEAADHKAEVELDLSRALWPTPADRDRARALAADARTRWQAAGDAKNLRDADAWLQTISR